MSARTKILAHCFSNIYSWITGHVGDTDKPKLIIRPVIVNEVHQVSTIIPGCLYLSGSSPLTADKLHSLGITAIVCALTEIEEKHIVSVSYASENIPKLYVRVTDAETSNLMAHFDHVSKYINDEMEGGGRVLVHCVAGISRSPSLIMAYLIRYKNLGLMDAYDYVADRRRIIQPNDGFFCQLAKYERRLRSVQKMTTINEVSVSGEFDKAEQDLLSDVLINLQSTEEPLAVK